MRNKHVLRCVIPEEELWERYEIELEEVDDDYDDEYEDEDGFTDDASIFSEDQLSSILTDVIEEATKRGLIDECSERIGVKTTILEDASLEIILVFPKDSKALTEEFDSIPGPVKKISSHGGQNDNPDSSVLTETLKGDLDELLFSPKTPDDKIRLVAREVIKRYPNTFLNPLGFEAKSALCAALFFFLRDFASDSCKKAEIFTIIAHENNENFFSPPGSCAFDFFVQKAKNGKIKTPMIAEYERYLRFRAEYLEKYGKNMAYWAHLDNIKECIEFYQKAKANGLSGKILYKDIDGEYYMQILLPIEKMKTGKYPIITLSEYANDIIPDSHFDLNTMAEHGKCILKDNGFEALLR